MHTYLLVVSSYQAEDVTSIRYGQEVTEEEGQAGVEAFSQLHVLGTRDLSVHIDSVQPCSPLHDFLNSRVFIPDFLPSMTHSQHSLNFILLSETGSRDAA